MYLCSLTLFPETPRPFSMVEIYLNTPSCKAVLPILLTTGLDSSGRRVCLSRTQASSTGPWWGMSPNVSSSWSISWKKQRKYEGSGVCMVYSRCLNQFTHKLCGWVSLLYSDIIKYLWLLHLETGVKPWWRQEHWRTDAALYSLPGHTCAGSLCPFPQPGWESSNICRAKKHTSN